MNKKIKITVPEKEHNPEEVNSRNKAMFTNDFEKGGNLAKTFIFTYINQPVSVTELTKHLSQYDGKDYDRATVYRILKKLVDKNILFTTTSGMILALKPSERKGIHEKVLEKYYGFLRTIPSQFQKRFQDINYFWISNGLGMSYIEWCCKLLGFKYEEEK